MIYLGCVNCDSSDGHSAIKLSSVNRMSEIRTVKANLISCKNNKNHQREANCIPQFEIKAWLDPKVQQSYFLLIDKVYDVEQRMNFPLSHPYMIQVSVIQHTILYPMVLKEVIDVKCESQINENDAELERKEAL